jgi:hypothetical protein
MRERAWAARSNGRERNEVASRAGWAGSYANRIPARSPAFSPEDLERIGLEIESFDNIDVVDDEISGIVARLSWAGLCLRRQRR